MKNNKNPQSLGGQATAIKLRKEALDRYYSNPNICLYCNSIIEVKLKQKIQEVRRKKFCSSSCSARHNNPSRRTTPSTIKCKHCGDEVNNTNYKRKYCDKCYTKRKYIKKKNESCLNISKKEHFQGKYYFRARSLICGNARRVYRNNNGSKKCIVCGYDKYTEVCHIKSVSSFSDDTLVSEINNFNNLVALCPNHHWEYDHGILKNIQKYLDNRKVDGIINK